MSGLETNKAIEPLLGYNSQENNGIEQEFINFCAKFNFSPNPKGSFGKKRKYWIID